MGPTLAGFQNFIRNTMGITPAQLPSDAGVIPMALAVALAIANPVMKLWCIPQTDAANVPLNSGGLSIYNLAVYNLAASNLINYAQDPAGRSYFTRLRKKLNITGFVSGIVQSSSDEGTSVSLVVQDAAKAFTLANLTQLKDPYGRQYLALAQSFGPTSWGIS
jgi:hypothetical protein